jgi:hypothetical protein
MIINAKINVLKIPKDKLFVGDKGTYLDCKITERKEPDQYGYTHTIYIQKTKDDEKIYIGEGKAVHFDKPAHLPTKAEQDDLPF